MAHTCTSKYNVVHVYCFGVSYVVLLCLPVVLFRCLIVFLSISMGECFHMVPDLEFGFFAQPFPSYYYQLCLLCLDFLRMIQPSQLSCLGSFS